MINTSTYFVGTFIFSALIYVVHLHISVDSSLPDMKAVIPCPMQSMIGEVTGIGFPVVMVEEVPADPQGSAKALVRITSGTQVFRQDKGVVDISELRVGQFVQVCFTGPVKESYPLQAAAGMIIIEQSHR